MTTIPLYQLDAFTDRPFGGNPAAVCVLHDWLDDATLQAIAVENNLSETAYLVADGDNFKLRWFTPGMEVDLCGHATLASAALILEHLQPGRKIVAFETKSGTLTVQCDGDKLSMDFPARPADEVPLPDGFEAATGVVPEVFLRAQKNMAVLADEAAVLAFDPDLEYIKNMQGMGLIVTAPGSKSDCASRYFAPHAGVAEDPVTGSAHCTIVPYWAARLGKNDIYARQVSARGGDLYCRLDGDRVVMAGYAKMVLEGRMTI